MNGPIQTLQLCRYCYQPKDGTGWHDCPEAQAAKRRLNAEVAGIKTDMQRPPSQRRLSEADKKRRQAMRSHVRGVENILKGPAGPENHTNGNN